MSHQSDRIYYKQPIKLLVMFSDKGNLIFLFLQRVNSIRRYLSLLLVLTKCVRGDETFVLKEFERLQ